MKKSFIAPLGLIILLSIILIYHFGFTWQTLAAFIFSAILLVLSIIDWEQHFLPDDLTLSLLWGGLFMNVFSYFSSLKDAVFGAIIGYVFMGLLGKLFYFFSKKTGLGQGDWKLFSALGAWFGWQALPEMLAVASLSAITGFGILIFIGKLSRRDPMPFGPFLALSGFWMLWQSN